jgi:hypothetical protein
MMKTNYVLKGIFGLMLIFVMMTFGCENAENGGETSCTVSFDAGEGSGTPPASQTVNEGSSITLPGAGSLIAPAGKEFAGWRAGDVTYAAGNAYTVRGNITLVAQWNTPGQNAINPFIGGIWLDWDGIVNYKFTEANGEKIYSTARTTVFNIAGTYSIDTDRKELVLRPEGGTPIVKSYEITGSLLVLEKGKAGEAWLTKNPETGGGFNGGFGAAPLGGMWQNIIDPEDTLGFNDNGEYLLTDIQKNRDGRYWWSVVGTYEYNAARNELVLRHNGIWRDLELDYRSTIYHVEFTTANQVLKLTESDGITETIFNKRDNL